MPNRLKLLREERGLTQEQVADRIGTTKQQVGRLENSKRRLDELWMRRLADAFEIHPGELWEEVPEPLTERERSLLTAFRKMDDPRQEAFVHAVDALAQLPVANASRRSKD